MHPRSILVQCKANAEKSLIAWTRCQFWVKQHALNLQLVVGIQQTRVPESPLSVMIKPCGEEALTCWLPKPHRRCWQCRCERPQHLYRKMIKDSRSESLLFEIRPAPNCIHRKDAHALFKRFLGASEAVR